MLDCRAACLHRVRVLAEPPLHRLRHVAVLAARVAPLIAQIHEVCLPKPPSDFGPTSGAWPGITALRDERCSERAIKHRCDGPALALARIPASWHARISVLSMPPPGKSAPDLSDV